MIDTWRISTFNGVLLAAYFVEAYLAFGVPAIAAGLAAPRLGLITTTYVYGGILIVLAIISFAAVTKSRS